MRQTCGKRVWLAFRPLLIGEEMITVELSRAKPTSSALFVAFFAAFFPRHSSRLRRCPRPNKRPSSNPKAERCEVSPPSQRSAVQNVGV